MRQLEEFLQGQQILILSLFLEMGEPFKMTLSRRTQPEASKQQDILQHEQLKYGTVLSNSKYNFTGEKNQAIRRCYH